MIPGQKKYDRPYVNGQRKYFRLFVRNLHPESRTP